MSNAKQETPISKIHTLDSSKDEKTRILVKAIIKQNNRSKGSKYFNGQQQYNQPVYRT